jgi:hypothetical protein
MSFRIQKGEGVIIVTEDGDFIFPSFDMAYPDVDAIIKHVGKGRVTFMHEWTRIEHVRRVTGWFGTLDGSYTWHFDKNKGGLEQLMRELDSSLPDDEEEDEGDDYGDEGDDNGDPFGADGDDDDD